MADGITVDVVGIDLAKRNLKELGSKAARRVVTRSLTKAARPMVQTLRRAAPVESGALRQSVRVISTKLDRQKGTVTKRIGFRNTKRQKEKGRDAFYVHMVVGGTGRHVIRPRNQRALTIGDRFVASAIHPGARANRFPERAARAGFGATVGTFENFFGPNFEKEAEKLPKP